MVIFKFNLVLFFCLQTSVSSIEEKFSVNINRDLLLQINKLFPYIGDNSTIFLESTSIPEFRKQSFKELMDKVKSKIIIRNEIQCQMRDTLNKVVKNLHAMAANVIEQYGKEEPTHTMSEILIPLHSSGRMAKDEEDDLVTIMETISATSPETTTETAVSEVTTVTALPGDSTVASLPEDTIVTTLPEDTTVTALPEDTTDTTAPPEDTIVTTLPEDTTVTTLPEDTTVTSLPQTTTVTAETLTTSITSSVSQVLPIITDSITTTTVSSQPNITEEFEIHLLTYIVVAYGIRLGQLSLRMDEILTYKLVIAEILFRRKQILDFRVPIDTNLVYNMYDNPAAIVRYIHSLSFSNSPINEITENMLEDMNNSKERADYFEMEAATIKHASRSTNNNNNNINIAARNILYIAGSSRTHYAYLLKSLLTIVDYLNTIKLIDEGLIDLLDQQRHIKEIGNDLNDEIIAADVSERNFKRELTQLKDTADYITARKGKVEDDSFSQSAVNHSERLADIRSRQLKLTEEKRSNLTTDAQAALKRIEGLFKRLDKIKLKILIKIIVVGIQKLVRDEPFVSRCGDMDVIIENIEEKIENIIIEVCLNKCNITNYNFFIF